MPAYGGLSIGPNAWIKATDIVPPSLHKIANPALFLQSPEECQGVLLSGKVHILFSAPLPPRVLVSKYTGIKV